MEASVCFGVGSEDSRAQRVVCASQQACLEMLCAGGKRVELHHSRLCSAKF